MKKNIFDIIFGYKSIKLKILIVLQLIGCIVLSIILVQNSVYNYEAVPIIIAVIFGIILGLINGFIIYIVAHIIDLLESSSSSLKVLAEKSESNNTDNT